MGTFDATAALLGGVLGTIAMTAFWFAMRAAGAMRLDWARLLGTLYLPPGPRADATGLGWHAAAGLLYGPLYAWILTRSGIAPTFSSGLGLGLLHAGVALVWMLPLTRFHPALRHHELQAAWRGRDLAAYAAGYVAFGGVFGAAYQFAPGWSSVWGMDPLRFWTAAGLVVLALGLVGLAARRALEVGRPTGPVFAAAEPGRAERREAIEAAYAAGRLTEAEYQEALAEWVRE